MPPLNLGQKVDEPKKKKEVNIMETEKVKKLMLLLNTMLDKKKDNEEEQSFAISKLTTQII